MRKKTYIKVVVTSLILFSGLMAFSLMNSPKVSAADDIGINRNPSVPDSVEDNMWNNCPSSNSAAGQTVHALYFSPTTITTSDGNGSTGIYGSSYMCYNTNYNQVRNINIYILSASRYAGTGSIGFSGLNFYPPNIPIGDYGHATNPYGRTAYFSGLSAGWNCWTITYDATAQYGSSTSNLTGTGSMGICVYVNLETTSGTCLITSYPGTVTVGQNFNASFRVENTGTTDWPVAGRPQSSWYGNRFKLGSANPYDNDTWGPTRLELPGTPSASSTTFQAGYAWPGLTYSFTAPTTPGWYTFGWRILQEGGPNLSGCSVSIYVDYDAPTTPSVSAYCSGGLPTFTANWSGYQGVGFYVYIATNPSFSPGLGSYYTGSTRSITRSTTPGGSYFTPGTTYYIRIYNGKYSGNAQFTAPNCPPNLSVADTCTSGGVAQFTATWSGIPNSGFRLDISTSSSFASYSSWFKGTAISHTDDRYPAGSPQFTAGTTYHLRVYNGLYSTARPFVANTCPPSTPTITQVCDANGFARVTIQWSGQPRNIGPSGARGFYVYMADNPGFSNDYYKWHPVGGTAAAVSTSTSGPDGFYLEPFLGNTSYAMQPLVRGTTYHVRIFNGTYSPAQSFVTINCPPKNVSVSVYCSSTGVSSATITWTGQPGNNIGPSGADGFYVDLATNSSFTANHYFKWAGNVYNTTAPNGFVLYGVGTPMAGLGNGITWYTRVNNGDFSNPPVAFTSITCRAPYLKAYGGDVRAGDGFGPSCTAGANVRIRAFNNGATGTGNAGAGSQAGVFATGSVLEFVSAAASQATNIANPLKGLTFSNTSGNPSYGGNFGSNQCAPDWYAGASGTNPGTTLLSALAAQPSNTYRFPGGSTFNIDATIPMGKRITIYVDGHAILNGTSLSYSSGTYTSPDSIPSVYIIARDNIYINYTVQRFDGVLVSRSGTAYTCTNGSSLLTNTTSPKLADVCTNSPANRLMINGAVAVPRARFLRFPYSVANAFHAESAYSGAEVRAAESFNFSPDFWISSNLPIDGTTPNRAFDSVTNPPPIL